MEIFNLSRHNQVNGIYVIHIGNHHSTQSTVNDCYMTAYIAHGNGTPKIENENIQVDENDIF